MDRQVTAEETVYEPQNVWEQLARVLNILHSHHCSSEPMPHCHIEHCGAVDEGDEIWDHTIDGRAEVLPGSHVVPMPSKQSMNEFNVQWANLQGIREDSVFKTEDDSEEEKYHKMNSLVPLTTDGQDAVQSPLNYSPPFRSGIPMKATLYHADRSDDIDVEVEKHLRSLSIDAQNVLDIRRIQPGRYEIDGRQVQVYRGGKDGMQYLVDEKEVKASGLVGLSVIADMGLRAYVNLVANVAISLRKHGVAPKNLTFLDTGSPTPKGRNDDAVDRYRAMCIACSQAALRESNQYYTSSNEMTLKN